MKEGKVVWRSEMSFEGQLDGFTLTIDAAAEHGGRNRGPRPKGLLLLSLAGCTGMDVVAILSKMRVSIDGFEVVARGELASEHPKKFTEIVTSYHFWGEDLPEKKLRRAVQLSEESYCGVRATLAPAVSFRTELFVNDERLADG